MDTKPHACPTCGAPVPADAPHGLCPQCLLKRTLGNSNTKSTANAGAADPEPAAPPLSASSATARLFAGDIPRLLHGDLALARPTRMACKTRNWTLRHPRAFAITASALLIVAVGAACGAWQTMRCERRQGLILKAQQIAQALPQAGDERSRHYVAGMKLLQQAAEIHADGDIAQPAMDLLARSGKAWRRIEHAHGSDPSAVQKIASSHDDRFLAAAFRDGDVEVFDVIAGKSVFKAGGLGFANPVLALSADGSWLAFADDGRMPGEVWLWRWATSADPVVLHAHAGGVNAFAFAPVGLRFATAGQATAELGRQPEIRLWDIERARLTQVVPCFEDLFKYQERWRARYPNDESLRNKISRLTFDPAATLVVARNGTGSTRILRLAGPGNLIEDRKEVRSILNGIELLPDLRFDRDGVRFMTPGLQSAIRIEVLAWGYPASRSAPAVWSRNRRQLVKDFLLLDLQAPVGRPGLAERITGAEGTWQPVHLPGRVMGVGPEGTWMTYESSGSAFLFWRATDVLEEWNRFGLRGAMRLESRMLKATPYAAARTADRLIYAVLHPIAFVVAALGCVTGSIGLGAAAASRKQRGMRLPRTLLVITVALGVGAVALGLAATVRLAFAAVWRCPDSVPLLAVAACYFTGWGFTTIVDAGRSYQGVLVGRADARDRSVRFFVAAFDWFARRKAADGRKSSDPPTQ